MVALRRPDLVRRLVLATGVFHHDGWAEGVLDGEPPDFLERSYGELSPDGIGHYGVMVAKLAAMHAREPALTPADLHAVTSRTLVMVADDDEVRLEHAIEAYRSLPDAELAVVPGTSHGLLVEKPGLCNLIITEFLTKEPVTDLRADPPGRAENPVTPRRYLGKMALWSRWPNFGHGGPSSAGWYRPGRCARWTRRRRSCATAGC